MATPTKAWTLLGRETLSVQVWIVTFSAVLALPFPCAVCSSPPRPCSANHLKAPRSTTQSLRALSQRACSLPLGLLPGLPLSAVSFSRAEVRSLRASPLVQLVVAMAHIPCVLFRPFLILSDSSIFQYNPSSARENAFQNSRFSAAPSEVSSLTGGEKIPSALTANSSSIPPYMWDTKDPDLDDALHNPDPVQDAALDSSFTLLSARGWANASVLFVLVVGLITLFAGYPIIHYYTTAASTSSGYNLGGINYTGQVPNLPGLPRLVDPDTPSSSLYRTGSDGYTYELVFSDEFNTDGRTFWPGDDPFWEAVNLHYW